MKNPLAKWFQRKDADLTPTELLVKNRQLEADFDLRTAEHEAHISELRLERDTAQLENDQLKGWLDMVSEHIDRDVPSILKQTSWPVGFYDFGKALAPQVRFFNCGIISLNGVEWLVARRSREVPNSVMGMNDLVAFKLVDNVPLLFQRIGTRERYKNEHFEDPRVFTLRGRLHVSATSFQFLPNKKWTGCHQVVCRIGDSWTVEKISDPVHGRNGGSLYLNSGDEKNWLWFDLEDRIYCVYLSRPHQVIEWNQFFEKVAVHETTDTNDLWTAGEPRGGTPPVRIGDEFFSFFHSSMPWMNKKRRYFMGCYAFEARPPFRITRMSTMPILVGSRHDPWHEGLPLVVFPCGALYRDGKWKVTLGVNDCACAWIEIPHDELLLTLRETRYVKPIETVVEEEAGAGTPEPETSCIRGAAGCEVVEVGQGADRTDLAPAGVN